MAFQVGEMAFFNFRQPFEHFLLIVFGQAVNDVKELDEFAVSAALEAVGIELKTPFFRFGERFDQRK